MQATPSHDLITAYLEHLRRLDRSRRTIGDRARILATADAELPAGLDNADDTEIAAWLYRDGWSKSTKETYYHALRSFYRWAVGYDAGLVDDPMTDLPVPHAGRGQPRPVEDGDLARILSEADEPYRLWALLAAYAGLRCIEISRLDRAHVTPERLLVHGKGDRWATVPTHPAIWTRVRDLPPGPVTIDPKTGQRWNEQKLSIRFAVYARRQLGMPGVALHRMRHWTGTQTLRSSGGNLRVTQEVMRHQSPTSTAIYTLISDAERTAAVAGLPILAAGSAAPTAAVH